MAITIPNRKHARDCAVWMVFAGGARPCSCGAGPVYRVLCADCGGEHWHTTDDDAAWREATAHERATGHETRVVTTEGSAS